MDKRNFRLYGIHLVFTAYFSFLFVCFLFYIPLKYNKQFDFTSHIETVCGLGLPVGGNLLSPALSWWKRRTEGSSQWWSHHARHFLPASKFPLHEREINIQPFELLLSVQLYAAKKILTDRSSLKKCSYYFCLASLEDILLRRNSVYKTCCWEQTARKHLGEKVEVKNLLWRLQKDILMHIISLIISSRDSWLQSWKSGWIVWTWFNRY